MLPSSPASIAPPGNSALLLFESSKKMFTVPPELFLNSTGTVWADNRRGPDGRRQHNQPAGEAAEEKRGKRHRTVPKQIRGIEQAQGIEQARGARVAAKSVLAAIELVEEIESRHLRP